MKKELKEKAREMRREGLSVRDITRLLSVSKSSVSKWVHDIELTEQQREVLRLKDVSVNKNGSLGCRSFNADKYLKLRQQYQDSGRQKALELDPLHLQGCMLYWAEGSKGRNSVQFSNSDVNMVKVFIKFIRECYSVADDEITLYIHCYDNSGVSIEEIKLFWLTELSLPSNSLRKVRVGEISNERGNKIGKLPYGVCYLAINRTDIVQHIYGAIQAYSGYDIPGWVL